MALVASIHFDGHLFLSRIVGPDGTFWRALVTTVYIAVIAQGLGVTLGLLSALAGRSRLLPLRLLSAAYVLVIRGTPVIVQIFFVYFGANLLLGFDLFPRSVHLAVLSVNGAVVAGIVALAINEGAYMSEIIPGRDRRDRPRPDGSRQVGGDELPARHEADRPPQAARVIVPPLGNEFNNMLKTTSLLAFIGVYELFEDADVHYSTTFKPVEYFAAVAVWYLLLTTVWSVIQTVIERRLAVSEREPEERFLRRFLGLGPAPARGVR